MAVSDIDSIRALLTSKPRPTGWQARRSRLDEVGAVWPVAEDVALEPVDCDGAPGEWSIVAGSDVSHTLMFFHGGGYCSGSILSHRRSPRPVATRARGRSPSAIGSRPSIPSRPPMTMH